MWRNTWFGLCVWACIAVAVYAAPNYSGNCVQGDSPTTCPLGTVCLTPGNCESGCQAKCYFCNCTNTSWCQVIKAKNDKDTVFCDCPAGYAQPNCTDIDECSATPNPCGIHGTCHNNPGSYSCSCFPGWTGTNCEIDIDGCLANPCPADIPVCTDTPNGVCCKYS